MASHVGGVDGGQPQTATAIDIATRGLSAVRSTGGAKIHILTINQSIISTPLSLPSFARTHPVFKQSTSKSERVATIPSQAASHSLGLVLGSTVESEAVTTFMHPSVCTLPTSWQDSFDWGQMKGEASLHCFIGHTFEDDVSQAGRSSCCRRGGRGSIFIAVGLCSSQPACGRAERAFSNNSTRLRLHRRPHPL